MDLERPACFIDLANHRASLLERRRTAGEVQRLRIVASRASCRRFRNSAGLISSTSAASGPDSSMMSPGT